MHDACIWLSEKGGMRKKGDEGFFIALTRLRASGSLHPLSISKMLTCLRTVKRRADFLKLFLVILEQ